MNKYLFCLILISQHLFAFDVKDKENFEQAKKCISCNLSEANFSSSDYSFSRLHNSDLTKAILDDATFKAASFKKSNLSLVKAENTHFEKAIFDKAQMMFFNGQYSNFSKTSFRSVNLSYANFYYANLSEADLTKTILKNADLSNSILIGAKISKKQRLDLKNLVCAVLPNGRVYNPKNEDCSIKERVTCKPLTLCRKEYIESEAPSDILLVI